MMDNFRKDIAPVDVIRKDFEVLRSHENLQTTHEVQDLLFMQSLEGRAHQGAGFFNKRTYVNTTIDDVVKALNRDPEKTKKRRQSLIDDIVAFVHAVINGEKQERLVNARGEPFLGFPLFKHRKINARDILRGLYMGGMRDNARIRKETEARYQVKVGCGECYLVNAVVMADMNLDGERLAHDAHEDQLASYIERGLIIDPEKIPSELGDDIRYFYIRHRLGPGQSDDAAIIVGGVLYNTDVALGIFLADAIDTLEKYAPEYKDQDQELAFFIGRGFKELQISMEDVYELSYLCAIPEAEEQFIPDSSLRYLMSLDERSHLSTLESHLNFIEGKPVPTFPVSYKQISSSQFYKFIKKRSINVRRLDALAVPDLAVQELDWPLKNLAQQNFLVVKEDQHLSEVVREFKATKSEIIIVVNKGGKIVGTLSATDLINLLTPNGTV